MLWRGADTVGEGMVLRAADKVAVGDGVERCRSSDGRGCYEEGQMK